MAGTFGRRTSGAGIATPHPGMVARQAPLRALAAADTPPELRFDYRPKAIPMLLMTLFLGPMAIGLTWVARDNDRGLIVNHLLHFDPGQATVIYWLAAALIGGCALFGLYGFILAISPPRTVSLDGAGITAPRNFYTSTLVTVPYGHIQRVRIAEVRNQRFLHIHHLGGKLTIAQSVMAADFETLILAIAERTARRVQPAGAQSQLT